MDYVAACAFVTPKSTPFSVITLHSATDGDSLPHRRPVRHCRAPFLRYSVSSPWSTLVGVPRRVFGAEGGRGTLPGGRAWIRYASVIAAAAASLHQSPAIGTDNPSFAYTDGPPSARQQLRRQNVRRMLKRCTPLHFDGNVHFVFFVRLQLITIWPRCLIFCGILL